MSRQKKCAICKKPVVEEFKPFCSKRCAEVDLGRWLGEAYAIPTREGPTDDAPETEEKEED